MLMTDRQVEVAGFHPSNSEWLYRVGNRLVIHVLSRTVIDLLSGVLNGCEHDHHTTSRGELAADHAEFLPEVQALQLARPQQMSNAQAGNIACARGEWRKLKVPAVFGQLVRCDRKIEILLVDNQLQVS